MAGIEMKLDTNALASLIESDPTFKASIQQSVLTNIANRYLKTANAEIETAVNIAVNIAKRDAAAEFGTYTHTYPSVFKLKSNIELNIKKTITAAVELETTKLISSMIEEKIAEKMVDLEKRIESMVTITMNRFTEKVVQDAVRTRINDAFAQIKF